MFNCITLCLKEVFGKVFESIRAAIEVRKIQLRIDALMEEFERNGR